MSGCRRASVRISLSLALAATAGGCQLVLSPTSLRAGLEVGAAVVQDANPTSTAGSEGPGARSAGGTGAGSGLDGGGIGSGGSGSGGSGSGGSGSGGIQGGSGGSSIISDAGAMLTGTVVRPSVELVSNNSASLTDVGGGVFLTDVGAGMFYRLASLGMRSAQGIGQTPVGEAVVVLEGTDFQPLVNQEVKTDSQGRFEFPLPAGLNGTAIVHAAFREDGLLFRFSAVAALPQSGRASVDVDAATTLLTAKVRASRFRTELLGGLDFPKLHALADLVRSRLTPENVPYMASGSADMSPAFDQLTLDDPAIRAAAAAVHGRLAQVSATWQVSKLFDTDDLVRLGIYAPGDPPFTAAGTFEVDDAGNLYFPRFTTSGSEPIEIVKTTQSGATSSFAVLPAGHVNPVLQAFGPDGTYFAAALEDATKEVHVFKGTGAMARVPGKLTRLPSILSRFLGGRIAVDAAANVACALPGIPAVLLKPPTEDGRILAGRLLISGYADGTGDAALFDRPNSAVFGPDGAIYVADEANRAIRRVTLAGKVTTVAGAPGETSYRNGRGIFARFGTPDSLALAGRTLFISDADSHRVRRISPSGLTFLVAGTGGAGIVDGPGPEALLNRPDFLALDGAGNLYLRDRGFDAAAQRDYQVIRKLTPP